MYVSGVAAGRPARIWRLGPGQSKGFSRSNRPTCCQHGQQQMQEGESMKAWGGLNIRGVTVSLVTGDPTGAVPAPCLPVRGPSRAAELLIAAAHRPTSPALHPYFSVSHTGHPDLVALCAHTDGIAVLCPGTSKHCTSRTIQHAVESKNEAAAAPALCGRNQTPRAATQKQRKPAPLKTTGSRVLLTSPGQRADGG